MGRTLSESERTRLTSIGNHPQVKNMDDFVRLGRYCMLVLLCSEFMTLTSLTNMVFMVYAGISPALVALEGLQIGNISATEACAEYERLVLENHQVNTSLEYQFHSVNVEFNMLCSEGRRVKDSISIQMMGVLVGAMIAGPSSDYYGRRTVLLVSLLGSAFFSFFVSQVGSFFSFTVYRTIVGLFTGGLSAVQGVFLIENIPRKHRLWINTVVTWSPNFIIFPLIAYLCGNWRNLSLFGSGISAVALLSLWILEESPRWRIQKGDIEGARISMERIRTIDGSKSEEEAAEVEAMLVHDKEQHDVKQLNKSQNQVLQLLKSKKYLLWTATICYGIMTASFVNYGLLFNMEKLSGSLYWNNTFFGVIRWLVNISAGAADYFFEWVGRKTINFAAMAFIIPSLAAVCGVYWTESQLDYIWIIRFSTVGITAMTSQLYLAKFMITSELFPTSVRNMVAAALSISSRVATIMSPQLFYLGDISPMLPYLVLLILSCIDWVTFQTLLPETKGRKLENSMPVKMQKNILSRRQSIAEA